MIVILSVEYDVSSQYVIDWLLHMKIPYYRINDTSSIRIDFLSVSNRKMDFKVSIKNPFSDASVTIGASEIKGFWYRRGFLNLQTKLISTFNSPSISNVGERINNYTITENKKIVDFFYKYFLTIPHLGCFNDNLTINKINNLFLAQKANILIPEFVISGNKSDVEMFLKKHTCCITKGIDRNGFDIEKRISLENFAKLITTSDLPHLPMQFNYSLIQQYIDKKADIRVFYIGGQIYSTAIFSQNDEKTKIDFRNYNEEKPNRIVSFKLPDNEEKKLRKLMKILNYETGSIDYVLDKNNDFYFLEINPIGQYDFISKKCNLFLDKIICNYFKTKCDV
jgi:ATP-GRASP peptide maturase of grasp-with-spasm system